MFHPYIEAAVLGAVQGLTEFIPISSSGHLVIVREIFGIPDQGNFFDAVLHLATLLAILIYFRKDWGDMLKAFFRGSKVMRTTRTNRRILTLIAVGTIPAIIAAALANNWIENNFRGIVTVSIFMIITGIAFWLVERGVKGSDNLSRLSVPRALGIGLAQALAILPGVSRSGVTIVAGMYMDLKREVAAKFSFLLAAPIIGLAGLYSLYQSISLGEITNNWVYWLIAVTVSVVTGILAIKFLLSFLSRYSLNLFAAYLVLAGAGLLAFNFLA